VLFASVTFIINQAAVWAEFAPVKVAIAKRGRRCGSRRRGGKEAADVYCWLSSVSCPPKRSTRLHCIARRVPLRVSVAAVFSPGYSWQAAGSRCPRKGEPHVIRCSRTHYHDHPTISQMTPTGHQPSGRPSWVLTGADRIIGYELPQSQNPAPDARTGLNLQSRPGQVHREHLHLPTHGGVHSLVALTLRRCRGVRSRGVVEHQVQRLLVSNP
jgi:hypothetical protein